MNVTIWRPFNGIGDWLMALACVKYINRQRPDVDVFVDWSQVQRFPLLVPELFALSDARFYIGRGRDGLVTHDSLVYRKWPPTLFLESMVCHLNDQTDLAIRYEHGVYPHFGVEHRPVGNTIVMIGHGKKRGARVGKDWGWANFSRLAELLMARGFTVVQVGSAKDQPIAGVRALLGVPAHEVVLVMAQARAFIGIENGISVLAGFMGVPQFTIYDGHGFPTRLDFAGQTKITERIEPEDACDRVAQSLTLAAAC